MQDDIIEKVLKTKGTENYMERLSECARSMDFMGQTEAILVGGLIEAIIRNNEFESIEEVKAHCMASLLELIAYAGDFMKQLDYIDAKECSDEEQL